MGSPHRQSVSEISYSLGIHVITLCKFRKTWRLQGEVMPCFQGNPEDCEPLDKFKVLQEKDGLKTMECTVATGSAACSLSRWTVGHMPPRIPMRSFYSPWPMRKSSRSAIPRVPDPSNAALEWQALSLCFLCRAMMAVCPLEGTDRQSLHLFDRRTRLVLNLYAAGSSRASIRKPRCR